MTRDQELREQIAIKLHDGVGFKRSVNYHDVDAVVEIAKSYAQSEVIKARIDEVEQSRREAEKWLLVAPTNYFDWARDRIKSLRGNDEQV